MLEINDLTIRVSGKKVLKNITLEIGDGKTLALLGPNGSGKTSLLMAIMGFSNYEIVSGEIIFNGQKINDLTVDERARLGMGVMLQRPPTIKGIKLAQLVEIIKKEEIVLKREAQKLNLEAFLDRDVNAGFSGGEIKRSELLQLLVSSPQLSLFDEPESGVDLENMALVGKVMQEIISQNPKNSSLIITHTGYVLDYVKADRGCVLIDGEMHCLGDPKHILATVKKQGYGGCFACEGEKIREFTD